MATSFEQNKKEIFNARAPSDKFTSKIPTMNNSSLNKRDSNYGSANIDRRTNKITHKRAHPVSSKSSQLSQSPVITRRSTKSVTQGHGLQSSWAVQPTEHANVTSQDIFDIKNQMKKRDTYQSQKELLRKFNERYKEFPQKKWKLQSRTINMNQNIRYLRQKIMHIQVVVTIMKY